LSSNRRFPTASVKAACLVILTLWVFDPRTVAAGDLLFPLKIDPILTSTFGEYRINHPHGGVDFGTAGGIGVPVVAAASGRLVRLKASPAGYGKAIYLGHPDGRVTVYGHLAEFAGPIKAIARKTQASRGRYGFDSHFGGDGPAVRAGEIIGYSGMTGTDVPHLHFEVRKRGLPVNPLKNGISLPDTLPPKIERLHARPLEAAAHVEGSFDPRIFSFDQADSTLPAPVVVGGRVGLSVEITDHIDNSPRDLAPYEIRFFIEEKPVHAVRYDRFNFAVKTFSELDYLYELKETKIGIFHRLYRHSKRIIFHDKALAAFSGRLPEGDHRAKILAIDAAGNRSQAVFTLRVTAPSKPAPAPNISIGGLIIGVAHPERHVIFTDRVLAVDAREISGDEPILAADFSLSTTGKMGPSPVIENKGQKVRRVLCDIPDGFEGTARVTWTTASGAHSLDAPVLWVKGGKTLRSPDGKAQVRIGENALFAGFPVMAFTEDPPAAKGLGPVSPVYTFNRPWEPVRKRLEVSIRMPKGLPNKKQVGLYLLDRGTYWHLRQGNATNRATHLGSFILMRDAAPPTIGTPAASSLCGRKILLIPYEDAGSGVAETGAALWLDGRKIICELMPVSGKIRYIPDRPLSPGTHNVRLVLSDRAGNTAEKKSTVEIR